MGLIGIPTTWVDALHGACLVGFVKKRLPH